MNTTKQITAKQVQLIHIAKSHLYIDDELYRSILNDRYNVDSSKKLTYKQASNLIDTFKKRGFKIQNKAKSTTKDSKVLTLATQAQRELIEVLKANIVWKAGDNGYNLWLKKRMGLNSVKTIQEASRVIEGLKGILDINTSVIQLRELPFPLHLDEKYFVDNKTGEIHPYVWVYDRKNKKLIKVVNNG